MTCPRRETKDYAGSGPGFRHTHSFRTTEVIGAPVDMLCEFCDLELIRAVPGDKPNLVHAGVAPNLRFVACDCSDRDVRHGEG